MGSHTSLQSSMIWFLNFVYLYKMNQDSRKPLTAFMFPGNALQWHQANIKSFKSTGYWTASSTAWLGWESFPCHYINMNDFPVICCIGYNVKKATYQLWSLSLCSLYPLDYWLPSFSSGSISHRGWLYCMFWFLVTRNGPASHHNDLQFISTSRRNMWYWGLG